VSEELSEEQPKTPATASDVKRAIRRRLRHHAEPEEMSLNIYPMMDMMTILLVFLIQQFATTSANVIQSAELLLPSSTSSQESQDAVPVQISRNEIVVDGKHVLGLRNGQVDPSVKQGGGTGFLVVPLLNVMEKHRTRLKAIASINTTRPFRGEVQIVADKRTPYRTLTEVVYTLGQAEFRSLKFVVLRQTKS
jgi:biopolymer transport protein ExbD